MTKSIGRLSEHHVALADSEWALWRHVGLRGAGFPAATVLKLAHDACAERADALLGAEQRALDAGDRLLDALETVIAAKKAGLKAGDFDGKRAVRRIEKAARAIRKGRQVQVADYPFVAQSLVEAYRHTLDEAAAARVAFEQCFARAERTLSDCTRQLAGDGRFLEAVTWQNSQVVLTGLKKLIEAAPDTYNAKMRYREELVASYLQRYCVKNDSIGFFGPFGWASISDAQQQATVVPGADLTASRQLYFEHWGINALAEAILTRYPQLKPHLIPRRMPYLRVVDRCLYLPMSPPIVLSPEDAALLQACDGLQTAHAIAEQVRQPNATVRMTPEQCYQRLRRLVEAKRITWCLQVPTEGAYPEQHLRRLLEQMPEQTERDLALAMLTELEDKRAAVAAAAGEASQLVSAMHAMESTFVRLTGQQASRRSGDIYAARTLLYEDCRRDAAVTFGEVFTNQLGPPLALVLHSARWFTYQLAQAFETLFEEVFQKVYGQCGRMGQGVQTVDFPNFWLWVSHTMFHEEGPKIVDSVSAQLQARWTEILQPEETTTPIKRCSAQLRSRVEALFAAPHPGWQSARFHSPDVMIAAKDGSLEQCTFILGELHSGVNALTATCFLEQHPTPADIHTAYQTDLPHPRLIPIPSSDWVGQVARTQFRVMSPDDIRLVFSHDTNIAPGLRHLPISDLVIKRKNNQLMVSRCDNDDAYPLVDVMSEFIVYLALSGFQITATKSYSPRISLDRLVIARESWRVSAETVEFAFEKSRAERFLTARHWVQAMKMPRFVFAKLPTEKKPFYVDFYSPHYVSILAKHVRHTYETHGPDAVVTFTEMLPLHDQAWLTDAEQQTYTSELRLIAVDRTINHLASRGKPLRE